MEKTHKFLALVVILIAIASFFLWRETHISVSSPPTYFLRLNGTPTQDERVTSAAECKAALGFMGINANNVKEVNDIVQAPGCFFNNLSAGSGTPLAYYNKNVDTSRSGFCTPNPGYAVCVVRKSV